MIDSQGGPERERLGMTWTLFLFISPGKGALTHPPPLAGGGMALRPPGDGGWGGSAVSFPPRRYIQQTPTAAWASDAAASIYWGFGAVSHQQAAPGIYRRIACHYYHNLSKGLNAARFGGILCSCQFDKSYFLEGVL